MRRFYRDVIGLTPRTDREQHLSFAWGPPPHDVRLTIAVHDAIEGGTREPERIMLHLGVDDIHATADRLRGSGVAFTREPEQEPWGGWIATFHDPDGNTMQLLQALPDAG